MPLAPVVAGRMIDRARLSVSALTRSTASAPRGGLPSVVTEATARSVPGIGSTENGLPPVATVSVAGSSRPTCAVDEAQASERLVLPAVGAAALPQAQS